MRPLFLIGFPGCGKTTLGCAVAQLTSIPLIDLDEYVESRQGRSLTEIFNTDGEARFRQLESEALEQVARMKDVIIACGGGTPCQPGLMDIMLGAGTVVWLQAPVDVIHTRLLLEQSGRPLLKGLDPEALRHYVMTTLDARSSYYAQAPARFDSSQLETKSEIDETARRFIKQFMNDEL